MKNKIRKEIKEKRMALSSCEIDDRSEIIAERFLKSNYYKEAQVIMSYMSIKNEVDTTLVNQKIIRDGKKLLLPVINENDEVIAVEADNELSDGKYGIREPKDKSKIVEVNDIDIIIVPGVAFDKTGRRIGFGKGYYDRFLKDFNGKKIALAFDFQIVEIIETEEHDIGVDYIFSDGRS